MRPADGGLIGGLWSLRLSRFAVIGAGTTVIYAVLALAFSYSGIAATGASVLAFLITAVFSYAGHKYVTFASDGSHTFEVPRFLTVSATSLSIVSVLPAVLTGVFGLPAAAPILLACIVVPAFNYVVLGRWVFRGL
jgi:putative flippase GtrA